MDSPLRRTVIVGGGVIGLLSALEIARRGHLVTVVDPQPAQGATFAAAGMIAPSAEASVEHPELAERAIASRRAWPELLASLKPFAETPLDLFEVGTVFAAFDSSDRREIQQYLDVARSQGHAFSTDNSVADEPLRELLSPRIATSDFASADAFVDPDGVVNAIMRALASLNVEIRRQRVVTTSHDDQGVSVVCESGEIVAGDRGIVATGYDGSPLPVTSLSPHVVRPIRGITVRLFDPESSVGPMVRGIVRGRWVYIVRRPGGSILIGASSDESEDRVVEAGALRRLLEDAATLMPSLEWAHFEEVRVGLRPATGDHSPFFNILVAERWAWSSGHFRHGFLMAPNAARDAVAFVES